MMLKFVRHLGLGSPHRPRIPGMEVLGWRTIELKSSKTIIALVRKESVLYAVVYEDTLTTLLSALTESASAIDIETDMHIDAVNLANIYPSYASQFALYCEKRGNIVQKDVYIKRAHILDLVATKGIAAIQTSRASQITAHEASICERVSTQQHPNIAEYLGVQVSDMLEFDCRGINVQVPLAQNCIIGLAFKRYDCTLHELVIRGKKFDVKLCLQSVSAGIQHLHNLGIVHGDMAPHNIFVKRDSKDHFVIGDFDSAHETGRVIEFKAGDARWTRRKRVGKDVAEQDDDWIGFRNTAEWIVVQTGGKMEDYKGIGKLGKVVNFPVRK